MSSTNITKKTRNQKHDIIEEIHSYNICLDSREIFLHGEPGDESEDAGVDFRMANKLLKNIRLLEANGDDPIIIHQHSVGGWWASGMMMFDAIQLCQCHIIFVMHGEACSMGSVIPHAADTRIITPNCLFMIHNGTTGITSDLTYKQSKSWAEMEDRQTERMLDIYAKACINGHFFQKDQKDEKQVKAFITSKMDAKEDWWLSARDAVLFGFADAVLGDEGYESVDKIRQVIMSEYE